MDKEEYCIMVIIEVFFMDGGRWSKVNMEVEVGE